MKDGKGATLSLDLKGIADGAVVPRLTPHAERRHSAAIDQRPEKTLLFEGVPRAQHGDLGLVSEAEGNRLFGHERTTARKGRAHAMDCMVETFQQRSLVVRIAG